MIDQRQFLAWLDLFTDDTRYLLPIHRNTANHEFTDSLGDTGVAHFDDDKDVLKKRVVRMASGRAWAEDPPSIQRHLITNIQISLIKMVRLRHAAAFKFTVTALLSPELSGQSIFAIALRWGFNDPAYFSRAYKAKFAKTPREDRGS